MPVFLDNFNSDEERLTWAFPLAQESLKDGIAGYKVAAQYFNLAFCAAIRLGRYSEAIAATYGLACAGCRAHEHVELIKSHHSDGSDWFDGYLERLASERARELGLICFPSWYKM
jgi:hypothetical protein